MSDVKPERLEFDAGLSPIPPAHSLSGCGSPWNLEKAARLLREGGGFPQTAGLLGSPSSPYRNWAPPATHGVYSLFPNDTLYQPGARYHHTLSHPKESLFALSSPPIFHSPVPNVVNNNNNNSNTNNNNNNNSLPVERGITQLELMTKGFNNNTLNNNNNTTNGKRFPEERRSNSSTSSTNNSKKRWESPEVPITVKNEVTNRSSCGCRHSPSPSSRSILPRNVTTNSIVTCENGSSIYTTSPSYSVGVESMLQDRKKVVDANPGGCSRTNPVSLRSNLGQIVNSDVVVGNLGAPAIWNGTAGIVIKKEPGSGGTGNGVTPCQVAEVTTSVTPLTTVVKLEAPTTPCRKDASTTATLPTATGNIPVGIAVARQRLQEKGGQPTQAPCGNTVSTEMQQAPISTMALVQQPCDDRLTNGLAPWASTTNHTSTLTPPTPTLWQYPALPVEHLPLPPVGYQLIRDPMTGHFLLIPTTNVLWPTYQAQPMHATHLATHEAMQGYDQRILLQQPQARTNVETKRRVRVKEEKIQDTIQAGLPQHFLLESDPQPTPVIDNICKRSQATSPVSCLTPPPDVVNNQSESGEDTANNVAIVSVQDASNQTDTPPVSEDETLAVLSDIGASMLATEGISSDFHPPVVATQTNSSSSSVVTDSIVVSGCRSDTSASNVAVNNISVIPVPEVFCSNNSQFLMSCKPVIPTEPKSDLTSNVKVHVSPPNIREVPTQIFPPPNSRDDPVKVSGKAMHVSCDFQAPPLVGAVDLSGLELLSNSIEQFESKCVAESKKDISKSVHVSVNIPETGRLSSDMDMNEEKAAESLQLLSAKKKRFSIASDISSCNSVFEREFELEGLEVNDDFKRLNIQTSSNQSPARSEELNKGSNLFGGLGLLCALAEQRFIEEGGSSTKSETGNTNSISPRGPEIHDVYRNYKTQKSERECKKFIASKQQQYYHSRPSSPVAAVTGGWTSPPPREEMINDKERNMRMQLADLQRQYREKQRELSKLTPKKFDDLLSPTKRGPGRPRKKSSKLNLDSPPGSPKNKLRRDLAPPVLEKIMDSRWPSNPPPPRLKSSKLDILKPPTLTANRILTSPKFKPEMKNGCPNGTAGKGVKLTCNINLMKMGDGNTKIKDFDKTDKVKGKGESIPEKKSGFPLSRANHTFGSKPPARLPRPGENESLCWFKTTPETLKVESKPPTLIQSVPTCSSSKKRKVGRPKKHLSSPSVATETIVAKKPKSKSSLVGFVLTKSRRLSSSDVPSTFKNSSSYIRTPSYVPPAGPYKSNPSDRCSTNVEVFSSSDHAFSNGFSIKKKKLVMEMVEETKSHKILPKLKAEAKVKTWTPGDDDEEDWVEGQKEEKLIPSSIRNVITKPIKRKPTLSKPETTPPKQSKVTKKCISNEQPSKPIAAPLKPIGKLASFTKASSTVITAPKRPLSPMKTNGTTAKVAREPNKKRCRRSDSSCSSNNSLGTNESDDLPLSVYSKKTTPSENVSSTTKCKCLLTEEDLNTDRLRALTVMGGLFYAGELTPIQPPDVYGIKLDGERGNRPHILSREEVLKDAIQEVKVSSISELPAGTRVCAYWSQQYRCLYPGTVAPNNDDAHFVGVEFDDDDNGRINIDDIRLLPADYPIMEYDPNPLLSLGRRRRRTSGASCDSHSRRTSADISTPATTTTTNNNNNNNVNKSMIEPTEVKEKPIDVNGREKPSTVVANKKIAATVNKTKPNNKTSSIVSKKNIEVPAKSDGKPCTDQKTTGEPKIEQNRLSINEVKNGEATRSSKERKRLKKRRREKLKRLNSLSPDIAGKKRKKKHRCCDEHCRHRRHHRRHRKHKHRHSHSKESDKRDSDTLSSRLSPVLEQLDILEIQQTAIRQLTNENKLKEEKKKEEAEVKVEIPVEIKKEKEIKKEQEIVKVEEDEKEDVQEEQEDEEEEEVVAATDNKKTKKKAVVKAAKKRDRQGSAESRSKMAAFLPARQLWDWAGRGFKRPGAKGRGKKEFFKSIQRGKETIMVGDCAVFLSTGRPDRPYIGRIESMWESWGTNMVVRVKWFYHPEETTGCPSNLKYPGALFESPHVDENDVQTISHKCEVLHVDKYTERMGAEPGRLATIYDNNDIYYQAGYYDPTTSVLTVEKGVTR